MTVAQSNAKFAKLTNDRWKDSPKGVVSEQERDEKEAAYNSALAKLDAAKSQVQFDQADVSRLEAMSEFKKVQAPYEGIITKRQIDIGDLVTAGSTSSTTPLYDIAQADRILRVCGCSAGGQHGNSRRNASQRDRTRISRCIFKGTVARTSHSIDVAKTLRVEVDIDNQDLALLPGMYLEVTFQLERRSPVVRIPAAALVFRSSGPEVAVVDRDHKVEFHAVTICAIWANMSRSAAAYPLETQSLSTSAIRWRTEIVSMQRNFRHLPAGIRSGVPMPTGVESD